MKRMRRNCPAPLPSTAVALLVGAAPFTAFAGQVDIVGPPGSIAFGQQVAALPNGNIVVIDSGIPPVQDPPPGWPPVNGALGAIYLYDPNGNLISRFTGSTPNDHVGSGGLVVLSNGNFVVVSPLWSNGSATPVGAATWVDGSKGLSGVVSASNSLVGIATNDFGYPRVTPLPGGNYVVCIPTWNNQRGAAIWADGTIGVSGTVAAQSKLVGEATGDFVGARVTALTNGNYVVLSSPNGSLAATLGDGTTGIAGPISAASSLHSTSDAFGYAVVTPLANGNWVLASASWNGFRGAVTWASGTKEQDTVVSPTNSIVGATADDWVGEAVTPLANGNYVVQSVFWNGNFGAATWADGTKTTSAIVSAINSLVGSATGDQVGGSVTALTNGNYVVSSYNWNNNRGAATWGDGNLGASGTISRSNSLVGSNVSDSVGFALPLSNGNYVVSSPSWKTGRGAATWGNGLTGISGQINPGNSLVGSSANDNVGAMGALTNGNYVVGSPSWNGGIGAAAWANGSNGTTGVLLANNSLVGSTTFHFVGSSFAALSNGNYVVGSRDLNDSLGAITWCHSTICAPAVASTTNSLLGVEPYGNDIVPLSDGNYVVRSRFWNQRKGEVTLVNGAFRFTGTVEPWNTVFGTASNGGLWLTFAYDATRQQLAVGRPYDNLVSLLRIERVFSDGFEGQ